MSRGWEVKIFIVTLTLKFDQKRYRIDPLVDYGYKAKVVSKTADVSNRRKRKSTWVPSQTKTVTWSRC